METPKFSGQHRRFGRPCGVMSTFHVTVAVVLLLVVLTIFFAVLMIVS